MTITGQAASRMQSSLDGAERGVLDPAVAVVAAHANVGPSNCRGSTSAGRPSIASL
jgi:hypothetical protein